MNTVRLVILSLLVVVSAKASACSVPVFRYALNYWGADSYELHALGTKLSDDLTINLELKKGDGGTARLTLGDREVWTGNLTPEALANLLDSPVRREITSHILKGDSVVWALVESGDAARDDAVANTLTERLRYLESIAIMPDLRPDDPFNRLGPGPTLAMRHSVVRLSRKDPREQFTLAMLERDAADPKVPIAYPVFGRGRVLIALPEEKLTKDNIDEVSQFLTASCSCEVKDRRLGWDLLLACDWEEELAKAEQQRLNGPVEDLHPATQPVGPAKQPAVPMTQPVAQSKLTPQVVMIEAHAPVSASPQASSPWLNRTLAIIGVVVVVAGVGGLLVMRKRA